MKKILAIFLAALMVLTIVPTVAFAKVADDDQIITEILDNSKFRHIKYVDDNDNFNAAIIAYRVGHVNKWAGSISGSEEEQYAKAILLALIERVEAELKNETFEKVIKILEGAQTAADLVNKVDSYTHILDLAENSTWATSLTVLNNAVKVLNFANDQYEKFMDSYAAILSCQAAGVYYGNLLQALIDADGLNANIKNAATELKGNITATLEEKSGQMIAELAADVAEQGAGIGIRLAMDTNTVTATIKTVYDVITGIGDKVFNATATYDYLTNMVLLRQIESVLPGYVAGVINDGTDPVDVQFAKIALLTARENGEAMLSGLGKVKADAAIAKIFKNTAEAEEMKLAGALEAAKLSVYADVIKADADYQTYKIEVSNTQGKTATVRNENGFTIGSVRSQGTQKTLNENGAFYSVHNDNLNRDIKVIITFVDGCTVTYGAASSGGSSSGSSSGFNFGSIFSSLFAAIANLFSSLFGAFKF